MDLNSMFEPIPESLSFRHCDSAIIRCPDSWIILPAGKPTKNHNHSPNETVENPTEPKLQPPFSLDINDRKRGSKFTAPRKCPRLSCQNFGHSEREKGAVENQLSEKQPFETSTGTLGSFRRKPFKPFDSK